MLKYVDGFDQLQGQTSAALLASMTSAGYTVTSGLGVAAGRHADTYALELQMSSGAAGANWSSRTNTIKHDLRAVAANAAGRWVAVGDTGAAVTTTDGIQWSPLVIGTVQDMHSIKCHAGTWIAVGNGGTIMRSTDGQVWTARTAPNGTTNLRDVAYGDNAWLAVGVTGSAGAVIISTDDGMTWAVIAGSQGTLGNLCVEYGDVWMVGGSSGQLMTSVDGTAFTDHAFGTSATPVDDIAYNNGMWLAVSGADVRKSLNSGANWAIAADGLIATGMLKTIAVSDGRWLIGGDHAALLMSDDGNDWVAPAFTGAGDVTIYDINVSTGVQVGWVLVGARVAGNPAATATIYVSLAPPTTVRRLLETTADKIVIGFAHRATARGRIFSMIGVFDIDWPAGIEILGEAGASVPIRNTWYYYEIVVDKLAETITLYVNNTLDLVVDLPSSALAMTDYTLEWQAENGAVARIDDIYLLDSDASGGSELLDRLQPIRIPVRMPTADVDVNWTGSDVGDHWPLIGLLAPSTSTFVRSAISGDQDLYSSDTALPEGAGEAGMEIIAVGLMALAQKSDLDARQLGLVIGAPGNQTEVVDTLLSITPEYSFAIFEKAPGDIDWDAESVVDAPFGIVVRP